MRIQANTRAFTVMELLVVIAIIAVLSSFLFGAISGMFKRAHNTVDVSNMRQVYVAVTLYEQDNNDRSPDNLGLTLRYAKSPEVFNSKLDPRPQDKWNSGWTVIPVGIQTGERVPYRISYPYLRTFLTSYGDRSDRFDYAYQRARSSTGMIANPWIGNVLTFSGGRVEGQSEDSVWGPSMDGPVDRIRMDGAYFHLPRRQDTGCLGACASDMFFYRSD